jgi:ring-1,2-phenylacetyl-CoA epoxidase subunit PaaE
MTQLQFHELSVARVEPLTGDSVAVTFDVPGGLTDQFAYLPGQHVTVRAIIDGADVRRSYSIAADAASGALRIGVKRLVGGAFSTYATTALSAGDTLEVMPPVGEFTISPTTGPRYGAVAAGSGITPVLSLIATTLAADDAVTWRLVFGNRGAASVMFLEELEALKDRYTDRFQIIHVLTREETDSPLLSGRLDAAKIEALCATILYPETVDDWYLCGPYDMVMDARRVLEARGHDPARIHDELFFAGPIDPADLPPEPAGEEGSVALEVVLEGRRSELRMSPDATILDAAMRARPELPYSCKGGMCASCKAHLVEGEVTMAKNYALVDADLAAGFVLTCQAKPTTERVVVDYDRR